MAGTKLNAQDEFAAIVEAAAATTNQEGGRQTRSVRKRSRSNDDEVAPACKRARDNKSASTAASLGLNNQSTVVEAATRRTSSEPRNSSASTETSMTASWTLSSSSHDDKSETISSGSLTPPPEDITSSPPQTPSLHQSPNPSQSVSSEQERKHAPTVRDGKVVWGFDGKGAWIEPPIIRDKFSRLPVRADHSISQHLPIASSTNNNCNTTAHKHSKVIPSCEDVFWGAVPVSDDNSEETETETEAKKRGAKKRKPISAKKLEIVRLEHAKTSKWRGKGRWGMWKDGNTFQRTHGGGS